MTDISMEPQLKVPGQTTLPASTLIICSRNRPKLLTEAVESILKGNEVPTELIIIDQSDKDNPTLAALRTDQPCEIHYIWSQERGLSRANNLGATRAHHDILVFTHDDVLISPTWYKTIVRALVEAGPRSIVSGQVQVTEAEQPGGFQLTMKTEENPAVYQGRIGKDVLLPLNMAMYRCALQEVKGFDVRLGPGTPNPASEDSDFGFRLLEAGYQIIYEPQAVIYHRAFRNEEEFLPLRWSYGVGRGAFYAKHSSLQDRYMLKRMFWDIRIHFELFFQFTRHERKKRLGDVVLASGIIFGAIRWLITQRRTN